MERRPRKHSPNVSSKAARSQRLFQLVRLIQSPLRLLSTRSAQSAFFRAFALARLSHHESSPMKETNKNPMMMAGENMQNPTSLSPRASLHGVIQFSSIDENSHFSNGDSGSAAVP